MVFNDGDFVLINYTIRVREDGDYKVQDTTYLEEAKASGIFDPNRNYGPYLVVVGKSHLIEAVDEEIKKMEVGQKKEITAPPEKAYGEVKGDLIIKIPLRQLKRYNIPAKVGQKVELGGRVGVIKRIAERFAYIDFNHPLAGKELSISLEVVRKIDTMEDKVKYLAERWLGLKDKVAVESKDDSLNINLPGEAIGVVDLESKLQLLLRDIYQYIGSKEVNINIKVKYAGGEKEEKKEEKGEKEEREAKGEAKA